MKIKKGDQVEVLSGKDKGKRGEVVRAIPTAGKVVVRGVAMVKKAQRPTQANQQGGIIEREAAIDVSNVALIDSKTDMPTRVGYRFDENGTKVRYAKRSGEEV
ncbi:50S ribosomal protein L24 [uncultured Fretibacterium sp.]|uniref:50S ribosomal protein L24 n=1 Tax=uncultured Fretibacterium sp. TaxID=1678694 RepID=UPI002603EE9C|nr:50S ribosomal protein L24 [uncultured Fretibacterium sp.]